MLEEKLGRFLESAGRVSLAEIDEAIEHHTRQVDVLRLLRQIVEIQEETQFVGAAKPNVAAFDRKSVQASDAPPKPAPPPTVSEKPPAASSSRMPKPGALADRVYRVLESAARPLTTGIIAQKLAVKYPADVSAVLKKWEGRVFKNIDRGLWEALPMENTKTERTPTESAAAPPIDPLPEQAPATAGFPLDGNASLIAAYLQRNQPAKPHVVAGDLKLPIAEVVMLLQRHNCFEMNGRGWMVRKAVAR